MNRQTYQLPAYIQELDGLRALAVLSVMTIHAGLPGFTWGALGVPLFFVLSGFLITGILLDADKGRGYFKNFYTRRTLRIFPIYYLSLVSLTILAVIVKWNVNDWPWYLVYVQNFLFCFKHFPPDFPRVFDHTWSLAVEEQFYFIWPFLIWALRRRWVFMASLIFIPLALALRYLHPSVSVFNVWYTILPSNLDTLGGGAALAIAVRVFPGRPLKKVCNGLFIVGAIAWISLASLKNVFGAVSVVPFLDCCIPVTFTGLIGTAVISPPLYLSAPLRLGWLRYIGKISYGLYLYHPLVYGFVGYLFAAQMAKPDHGKGMTMLLVLSRFGLAFIVASLSWHILEKRMNSLKRKYAYRKSTADEINR